ncbi:Asparagine synthetase domain-containing protein 1 [Toxocara canis]|uniref:Asparagine synthetase domain-containing protein 1 n=1 Tax=Toxocara canis TaxID=6265 RepID=A0A0B2W310_TOXCA|nr:Asparagine synthetase domain-containing protein 1 [Toxocara canis]
MAETCIWKDHVYLNGTESTQPLFNSEKAKEFENAVLLHYGQILLPSQLSWSNVPSGTVSVLKMDDIWSYTTIYSTLQINESSWAKQFVEPKFVLLSALANKLLNTSHESLGYEPTESELSEAATEMVQRLRDSVRRSLRDVLEGVLSLSLLFSGGVDSLLLAHVLHKCIPVTVIVDLINVSFDDKSADFGGAPDRPRGIEAFKHLRDCYPERHFRLILANVSSEELTVCRPKYIARLVAPSFSVLDDSIACVLWFAARAEGFLYDECNEYCGVERVKSRNLVVLRYRYLSQSQELWKIGERNLGRDDRVISGLGIDVRAPFLDDAFVEWVNRLPLELKADFTKERGAGEKIIIRQALKVTIPLRSVTSFKKRPESSYCLSRYVYQ